MAESRRLVRSESDRMIGGVCGGISEYFGFDPTLVRLVFILFCLMGGGVFLYLILWLIMPTASKPAQKPKEAARTAAREMKAGLKRMKIDVEADSRKDRRGFPLFGLFLILLGLCLLLRQLGVIIFNWGFFWAALLILLGLALLLRRG